MVISKENLTDLKEIYEKALKLVNEESKNDPPTDPFRSHYAARDLMLQLKENLNNMIQSYSAEDYELCKIILGWVYRDLGRIYIFTEEISAGEKAINDCLESLENHKMKPEAIIPYIGALNELSTIFSNRGEHQKACEILLKAETMFLEFDESKEALLISDIFGTPDEVEKGKGKKELDNVYTLSTYFMAQVFGHLGELEKSAQYCHKTLRRQWAAKTYEAIDFSLNLATLSQYYIGRNMYKEARYNLSAATLVMAEHETKMLTPELTEQQRNDVIETYKHRYADLARCWAKYGLNLLEASKERLYNDDETKIQEDLKNISIDPDEFRLPGMVLSAHEDRISADYCLTFDDAKLVYHFVINWLDQAKEYYKPDTEATEYSKIIKDYADLYLHMAFFEEDPVNQSKMHKRRAKYYEDLLELLNPVFYMSICRDCWYGAGHAYSAILDIRLDSLNAHRSTSTPQDVQKINQACQKAIKHFKQFLDSYMDKNTNAIKAGLDVEEERIVLSVYFHLGRLHYKMMTPDLSLQLENMENSLKYYKLYTDECDIREEAAKTLQAEVGVCREMVNLLPLKIANLKKRLNK